MHALPSHYAHHNFSVAPARRTSQLLISMSVFTDRLLDPTLTRLIVVAEVTLVLSAHHRVFFLEARHVLERFVHRNRAICAPTESQISAAIPRQFTFVRRIHRVVLRVDRRWSNPPLFQRLHPWSSQVVTCRCCCARPFSRCTQTQKRLETCCPGHARHRSLLATIPRESWVVVRLLAMVAWLRSLTHHRAFESLVQTAHACAKLRAMQHAWAAIVTHDISCTSLSLIDLDARPLAPRRCCSCAHQSIASRSVHFR